MVKPIIYGNIARHFGKKREEDGHTHQVGVFRLHSSEPNKRNSSSI